MVAKTNLNLIGGEIGYLLGGLIVQISCTNAAETRYIVYTTKV